MNPIHIANSKGRSAMVATRATSNKSKTRKVDTSGQVVSSLKVQCSTVNTDIEALITLAGSIDNVAQLLIDGDPDLNIGKHRLRSPQQSANLRGCQGNSSKTVHQETVTYSPSGEESRRTE